MTEATPEGDFWEAEPEYQDYLERLPGGYTCHFVRPGCKRPRRMATGPGRRALLDQRLSYLVDDGEAWFDATQNARIVRAAERYYRIMYTGSTEAWNLRDRHMFDTLQAVTAHRGFGTKAVVWAHNSHVGNAAATAMGWRGEFNIGELCKIAYGDDAVLIGFGTDMGTVAAASDWGAQMQVKTVPPARPDSYEHAFRLTGVARSLTDWRGTGREALIEALRRPMLERAIGVVYRPKASSSVTISRRSSLSNSMPMSGSTRPRP